MIPAAARGRRSTGSMHPYYGDSGVCPDTSTSYQTLCSITGHGQPSIFHPQAGKWNDMRGSGAASSDDEVLTQPRRWGGFPLKPPTTSTSVQPNVLLGRKGTISCESGKDVSVRPVVGAHIVPHRVRSYNLPLRRDSWDHFPVQK